MYYLAFAWFELYIPSDFPYLEDSRSVCNCSESANLVIVTLTAVSSAKSFTCDLNFNLYLSDRSFMIDKEENWHKDRSLWDP